MGSVLSNGIYVLDDPGIGGEESSIHDKAIRDLAARTASLTPNYLNFRTVAAGTAYSLTNTAAALDFGTTDPVVTITTPGTYKPRGWVVLAYNGATFAASRTVTIKLRRTNNTAADLTNGTVVLQTAIITTVTATFMVVYFQADDYVTLNSDDSITIFADVSTVPSAGSLDATAAWIEFERKA